MSREKQDEFVSIMEELLRLTSFEDIIKATDHVLPSLYPNDVRIWRLRGVAFGALGEHEQACEAFSTALQMRFDETTLANYVTSLWAVGWVSEATSLTNAHYDYSQSQTREILLYSAFEAVRLGVIAETELPEAIMDGLNVITFPN